MKFKNNVQSGFTLVEMAIVLVIFGLVLAALLLPLRAQREQAAQAQTVNALDNAKQALLGFALASGRLPCPASLTSSGLEDPTPATGACNAPAGFLPAATLGIQPMNSSGFAIDAWNNPIRYVVTSVNTSGGATTPDFTTQDEMSRIGIAELNPNIKVCADSNSANCSATNYLIKNAVAVIFSTGANFGQSAGVDEASNLSATTTFYSRAQTASSGASTEFDDKVIWISPYVLYNAMIQAGQLH